jgi:hypothetical protein
VTGLATAGLGILGTVVAFALADGGGETSFEAGTPIHDLNRVCNTLAAETDTQGAYFALARAAAALRNVVAAEDGARNAILTSADELDEAVVLLRFNQEQDATPAVISAVDRLAALGATSCRR